MNVLLKLTQQEALPHRDAVAHDVEIGSGEVDDLFARAILYVRITNVPLARDRPVEDPGSRRNLARLQRKMRSNFA